MAQIKNLTPHPVTVGDKTYPPEGQCPRVTMSTSPLGEVDGLPVVASRPAGLEGLPAPEPGVLFVVSRVVAEAARDRTDLLVPDDLVRDDAGRVIGARRFASLAGQLPEPGEYLLTKVAEVASSASPYAHRLVVRAPRGVQFPARGDWVDRGWSGRVRTIDLVPSSDGTGLLCTIVSGRIEEGDGVVVAFEYSGRHESLSLIFARPGARYRSRTGYKCRHERHVVIEGPGQIRTLQPGELAPASGGERLSTSLADKLKEAGIL